VRPANVLPALQVRPEASQAARLPAAEVELDRESLPELIEELEDFELPARRTPPPPPSRSGPSVRPRVELASVASPQANDPSPRTDGPALEAAAEDLPAPPSAHTMRAEPSDDTPFVADANVAPPVEARASETSKSKKRKRRRRKRQQAQGAALVDPPNPANSG
jgi:hypothetical protein